MRKKIDFFLFVLIEMAFSEEEEKLLCFAILFHLRFASNELHLKFTSISFPHTYSSHSHAHNRRETMARIIFPPITPRTRNKKFHYFN